MSLHALTWVQQFFFSDLFSAKLSRVSWQFIVTLSVNNVCLYVYVSVWLFTLYWCWSVPMPGIISLLNLWLLCSLNSNIPLSLQFPPAASGLNLSRSYQHKLLISIKLPGWRHHQYPPVHIRTPTHTYTNTYTDTRTCPVSVIETSPLCHFTAWEYIYLAQEKRTQFSEGNYLHTIFWQKL